MISGLPKDISYEKINEKFNHVFMKMFDKNKVVHTKVIGKFDTLYKLCQKLKSYKDLYRYYRHKNKINDKRASKMKIPRGWCKKSVPMETRYDAEEYYKDKVQKTIIEINKLKREKLKYNSGIGFVSFYSNR